MPEDAIPDWILQFEELARQVRDGSDVPEGELLQRIRALLAGSYPRRPTKPTSVEPEQIREALRQKYGDLPVHILIAKRIQEWTNRVTMASQEIIHALTPNLDGAIVVGDIAQVRRLIAVGVNVNGQSAAGYSLLLSAGIQNQWDIVQILREAGAEVGLPEAALFGDVETLQALLDGGGDVNARNKRHGPTALNWAANKGRVEAVRLLLERGASVDNAGQKGFTPLIAAALRKHENVVPLLLAAGATVGIVEAALLGDCDLLNQLLDEGADIESENTACMTPLMAAAACGHTDCIRLLLDRGADLQRVNARNYSALTWAILNNQREAVDLLLDAGMEVNAPDQQESEYLRGGTPIRYAILRESPEMTRLLIERGARLDVRDVRGQTPLHWAAMRCRPEVMQMLLDAGSEINAVGAMQRTPLMCVVDHILVRVDNHVACVRLLLDRHSDVNARAEHGKTALMMAAGRGHTEVVKLLLDAGADIEAKDEYGFTALASAGQEGHAEIVALLKERGAKSSLPEDFL